MIDFLRFVLLLWGLVYLWVGSSIFRIPRMVSFHVLPGFTKGIVYCPACIGFWVGVFLQAWGAWPLEPIFVYPVIDAGIASSGMMAIMAYLVPVANATWSHEQGAESE